MTNIEYYRLTNIIFDVEESWDELLDKYSDCVMLTIKYKPRHAKENIKIKSIICNREDVVNEKAKWLLSEVSLMKDFITPFGPDHECLNQLKHYNKEERYSYYGF